MYGVSTNGTSICELISTSCCKGDVLYSASCCKYLQLAVYHIKRAHTLHPLATGCTNTLHPLCRMSLQQDALIHSQMDVTYVETPYIYAKTY